MCIYNSTSNHGSEISEDGTWNEEAALNSKSLYGYSIPRSIKRRIFVVTVQLSKDVKEQVWFRVILNC